jgi:hypothetical protein
MPCGVAPEVASETVRSRIASCRGILKGGARAQAHPTAAKVLLGPGGWLHPEESYYPYGSDIHGTMQAFHPAPLLGAGILCLDGG